MVILAVDYGDVRTGIAVCDKFEMLASPVTVISEPYMPKLIDKIKSILQEHQVELIVVGLPKNMDGSQGERANKCTEFAQELKKHANIPVELWDERMTTVSAHKTLNFTNTRGKKRKSVVDTVAAVMILQSYIDYRKNK